MSDIDSFPVYDLHSHTRASDGLLTPAALVQRAVEMRVGMDEAQQTVIDQALPIEGAGGR